MVFQLCTTSFTFCCPLWLCHKSSNEISLTFVCSFGDVGCLFLVCVVFIAFYSEYEISEKDNSYVPFTCSLCHSVHN